VTLAQMPNEQTASAGPETQSPSRGVPHLGLTVAPAAAAGAGQTGVVVTAVDPDGPAAEAGVETGNVILDVGGKAVTDANDIAKALREAQAQGKHDVLMRVKSGDTMHFVAVPLGDA
jgi:serine protease Do